MTTNKPNTYRRSIARHFRTRRYELATLAAVSAAAACANGAPSDVEKYASSNAALVTTAQGTTSAQNAINFLVPDAVAFTQANNCLSCHRQPDVLIATSTAAQLLPGVTLDTSASTGTGFIANLITGNQQSDGHWTDSGSTTSMSAESLWALAGYARAGGSINVLPNVKKGLLWLVPQASTITFPSDSMSFAGGQRTYLNNDFTDSPQMFDWFLPTAQIVFATRVQLDLDSTLSASNVSTLSAQQTSYTDALQGNAIRTLTTTTVQHLALAGVAMAESGRANSTDGQAIGAQLVARQTSGSGWGDPNSPDGTLSSVNTLTTGEALYALCRLGIRPRANPTTVGTGLDWLIAQQQSDGSWALPSHNSAVSSSWALLAMACASNPSGTAEFNPLTANGSPSAPVTETMSTSLNVTNTSSDPRTATITVTGGPTGAAIVINPSTMTLTGDSSQAASLQITLPAGLSASQSYPFTATVTFKDSSGVTQSQTTAIFTTAISATPDTTLTHTTTSFNRPPTRVDIGSSVTLAAGVKASDNSVVAGGQLAFTVDGQMIATVAPVSSGINFGTFTTSWTVPTLTLGTHTIHAGYLGENGTIVYGASAADQIITVVQPPPAAPVVSGVTDGSSSTDGNYTEHGTGTPGDTIAITANGVVVATATVGSDGTWSSSFSLSPGSYTIATTETGPGGTSSATSANVGVLPSAPTVGGAAPGTTFTSMETTVSGTATPGATINVIRGGQVVATTTAGPDGSYSVGVALVPGDNSLSVTETVGGQTSAVSQVEYNQTPSAPSIAVPDAAQKSDVTTVTGKAVPGATVVLMDNGVVIGSAVAGSDGSYSIPADLTSGQNNLTVQASVDGVPSASSRLANVRVDSDPPFFPAPPVNLVAWAPTSKGIPVTWPAISAYDAQDGQLASTCDHESGVMFPVGTTKVTCSSHDTLGNAAYASFEVKVTLQVLPTLVMPSGKEITVKTHIATGANVSFDVSATDAEGAPMAAECNPPSGSFFDVGTTKVTCTATDTVAKTSASSTLEVTVIPVPYLGAQSSGEVAPAATTTSTAGGGCNVGDDGAPLDFSALAAVGLAISAARSRKKKQDADAAR